LSLKEQGHHTPPRSPHPLLALVPISVVCVRVRACACVCVRVLMIADHRPLARLVMAFPAPLVLRALHGSAAVARIVTASTTYLLKPRPVRVRARVRGQAVEAPVPQ
jgi:hypothetical protein